MPSNDVSIAHPGLKLIFLDIDGVLNSSRSVVVKLGPTINTSEKVRELARLDPPDLPIEPSPNVEDPGEGQLDYCTRFALQCVDPVCVALVNRLLIQPDVGLVLSSTHRMFLCNQHVRYGSDEHLRRLRLYLEAMGLHVPTFFSVTPVLHRPRGHEIDTWLNMAYENGLFDDGDDEYVIIDDDADMLDFQPLVHTDAAHGFSFDDYAKACKHLGLKEPGLVL